MPMSMLQFLQGFLILFTTLYASHLLGKRLFPKHSALVSLLAGAVTVFGIQSLIQTACYYLNIPLSLLTDIASLVIVFAFALILHFLSPPPLIEPTEEQSIPTRRRDLLIAIFNGFIACVSTALVLRSAIAAATTDSIRSPWLVLPHQILATIALLWLSVILAAVFTRRTWVTALHSVFALGSTLAITPIIYRIGFGFDGFLHIASENVLLTTGTLHPKPFYYIGQYVFTTWIARQSSLPIAVVDRWLVPVFAALLIPLCFVLIRRVFNKPAAILVALSLLPLGGFIASTPQSFAYLLGFTALLLTLGAAQHEINPLAPLILALWASATHPLAGIPLLCVVVTILLVSRLSTRVSKTAVGTGGALLAGISVPVLFFVSSLRGGTPINWNLSSIFQAAPWLDRLHSFTPFIGNHFVLWPAWTNLISTALPLLLLVLALVGSLQKDETALDADARRSTLRATSLALIASAVTLWIAATALKTTGDFAFLIDYERGNYADRLNTLALLCLIPASLFGFERLWRQAARAPKIISLALIGTLIASSTALAYDSLPRHDALIVGHGWSTSASDLDAVKLIDRDAQNQPYTVLANQSVSAGAVSLLGFKRYAGDVFFYPIPTGGPLYDQFLHMTYDQPSWDIAREAGHLGQSTLVYVVIDDYWWKAATVSETLQTIANQHWTINDGKVNVYKFDLSTASNSSSTTSNE